MAIYILRASNLRSTAALDITISGSLVPLDKSSWPKWIARAYAASFPLGSIIPYMSSSTVSISLNYSFAVVPLTSDTGRMILIREVRPA